MSIQGLRGTSPRLCPGEFDTVSDFLTMVLGHGYCHQEACGLVTEIRPKPKKHLGIFMVPSIYKMLWFL